MLQRVQGAENRARRDDDGGQGNRHDDEQHFCAENEDALPQIVSNAVFRHGKTDEAQRRVFMNNRDGVRQELRRLLEICPRPPLEFGAMPGIHRRRHNGVALDLIFGIRNRFVGQQGVEKII